MRIALSLVLALVGWAATCPPVSAQGPPAHAASRWKRDVVHRKAHGGELHEVVLPNGRRYGRVVFKDGSSREVVDGVPGAWSLARYPPDGPPVAPPILQTPAGFAALAGVAPDAGVPNLPAIPSSGGSVSMCTVVSKEQVAAWGGWDNTLGRLAIIEDFTNEALARSVHPLARIDIVYAEQWVLNEDGLPFSDLWNRWTYGMSGVGSYAEPRYAQAGCDLSALLVVPSQYCGLGTFGPVNAGLHVMVAGVCAEANMSYAHELFHCAGAGHNVGDSAAGGTLSVVCDPTYAPAGTPVYPNAPYGVGWQDPSNRFRTVMSYGGAPRTKQLAAPPPAVWYGDGVTLVGSANNGRPTDEARCVAQGWMTLVNKVSTPTQTPAPSAPTLLKVK